MESAKNVRWIIPFKEFGMVRVKYFDINNIPPINIIVSFKIKIKNKNHPLYKFSLVKVEPFSMYINP